MSGEKTEEPTQKKLDDARKKQIEMTMVQARARISRA